MTPPMTNGMTVRGPGLAPERRLGTIAALAYGSVSVVHLTAQLAASTTLVRVTHWMLLPLLALAAFLLTAPPAGDAGSRTRRPRLIRLVLAALMFSWLGDALPDLLAGDTAFLLKVGFFLVAQLFYIAAFLPRRGRSIAARRRWAVLPYLAVIITLVVLCAPGAGALLVPILIYGVCLGTMAVLSTGLGWVAGVGGAIFLVSDSLIALGTFVPSLHIPASGFWVMAGYLVAQALIVIGVLREG